MMAKLFGFKLIMCRYCYSTGVMTAFEWVQLRICHLTGAFGRRQSYNAHRNVDRFHFYLWAKVMVQ